MQNPITQSEQDALHSSGDLLPLSRSPTAPRGLEPAEQDQPTEALKAEPPLAGTPSSFLRTQRHAFHPRRGVSSAAIAGVMAGVLAALLTIIITLVNAGTFHAASQQIAVDRLTVKIVLVLAAWELLTLHVHSRRSLQNSLMMSDSHCRSLRPLGSPRDFHPA